LVTRPKSERNSWRGSGPLRPPTRRSTCAASERARRDARHDGARAMRKQLLRAAVSWLSRASRARLCIVCRLPGVVNRRRGELPHRRRNQVHVWLGVQQRCLPSQRIWRCAEAIRRKRACATLVK
jgi:hypothetical protein